MNNSNPYCTTCFPVDGTKRVDYTNLQAFKCVCGSEMRDNGDGTFCWIEAPPAPPQQEGINIEQLETDFVDWYFAIKYDTGQQPLAMQIMYWFKQRLLTTPSPSNGAIYNASEIQRLLTEQQNKH
jgi:hypothetical protein